jgi:hypothetical protein
MDPNTTAKTYWKLIKSAYGDKQTSSIPPLLENDELITDDKTKATILNQYFIDQTILPPSTAPLPDVTYLTDTRLTNIKITPDIVKDLLTNLDISTSSGPDEISNRILRDCAPSLCKPLSDLFNKSISLGIFPDKWKEAIVTAIYKKENRQTKTNYRPISLLDCISKIFERIVHRELYNYLVRNRLLSEKNSGFKDNDSTINRMLKITDDIYKGLDKKHDMILVFLDISKAFDRVWHDGLILKLKQNGIDGNLLNWLTSYLTNRKQRVVVGGQSSNLQNLHAGVPQGSILGPLLFLVYINDLECNLESDLSLYADDITLIEEVINPTNSIDKINRDLHKISQWAKLWRVSLNPTKTLHMKITNKIKKHTYPTILMEGIEIMETSYYTNLGFTLKDNMHWDIHIDKIINKASKRVTVLQRLRYKIPRPALEKIYLTMIRPVLEYGNILYDNCTNQQSNKIEALQRRAALICSGAYRHTKHLDLLSELGWDLLSDRRKNQKLIMFYKITNKLVPQYLQDIILGTVGSSTTYNLRNKDNIQTDLRRLYISKTSLIPSTTRMWNALPDTTKLLPTLPAFKYHLKKKYNKYTPFHRKCIGKVGNWLTRIRLGLSALNAQRSAYHLIDQPLCPTCSLHPENAIHYFTHCPTYALARYTFYERLERELEIDIPNTNTEDIADIIIHGNIHSDKFNILLQITYEYMKSTERFR